MLALWTHSRWSPAGMSWLLIYRTDAYKKLRRQTEKLNTQRMNSRVCVDPPVVYSLRVCTTHCAVESKKKEIPAVSKQKAHAKALARMEGELKEMTRNMSMMKMKSMVFMTASMIAVFGILSSMCVPRPLATVCSVSTVACASRCVCTGSTGMKGKWWPSSPFTRSA